MPKIKFKIVTPEKVVFQQEIDSVTIPTQTGQITVLPNHIALLSALQAGEMMIKADGKEIPLAIAGGFIEVKPGSEVVVLTDNAEHADEIDIARAEQAHQRATELMKEKNREHVDYAGLTAKIEKELARLNVAKRKTHGSHQPKIES